MQKTTINEINEKYDLEIPKIVSHIKKKKAKKVLLQFPEGMKPYSTVIADEIEKLTNCKCFIWLGDCFGACDIPELNNLEKDVDLIIQFGHTKWNFKN
tara:strand:- start:208 stop:501 length:294 start_codon:yes stop_codon:yes gene_type:complete